MIQRMMTNSNNPHDGFFKYLFRNQQTLREFIENYLPQEMVSLFDLDSLRLHPDNATDETLANHLSDLIYEVHLTDQREVKLYLLFEHKSVPDKDVLRQIMRYMVHTWDIDDQQKRPWHPIIAIVFYHGDRTWNVPRRFSGLFDLPEPLHKYVPDFEYEFFHVQQIGDEDLRRLGGLFLQVGLTSLKYTRSKRLTDQAISLLDLLMAQNEGDDHRRFLRAWISYLSQDRHLDQETFVSQFEARMKGRDELMATLLETLEERAKAYIRQESFQEGIDIGKQEGRQEGLQEGLQEGKDEARLDALDTLHRILNRRFGALPASLLEGLDDLSLESLHDLMEQLYDVETLHDFTVLLEAMLPDEVSPSEVSPSEAPNGQANGTSNGAETDQPQAE